MLVCQKNMVKFADGPILPYNTLNNMKLLRIFACCSAIGLFLDLVLSGCASRPNNSEVEVMRVPDLTQTETAVESGLFDRFEPIVLETNDSSFVTMIRKAEVRNDTVFILDKTRHIVLEFGMDGHFLGNIGKVGDGPGEYTHAYSFALNPEKNMISLVIPFGFLYNFDLNGNFIDKIKLPTKNNYHDAAWLNGDLIVLWSSVDEDMPAISVYDMNRKESVYDAWHKQREINRGIINTLFCYDGDVYLGTTYLNEVYKIDAANLQPVYAWDFGEKNVDMSYFDEIKTYSGRERSQKFSNDRRAGILSHTKLQHLANDRYRFVEIYTGGYGNGKKVDRKMIFYDRANGKSSVFDGLLSKSDIAIRYMNDDYVLAEIMERDLDACQEAFGWDLDVADDDNPVLVKMYFKK